MASGTLVQTIIGVICSALFQPTAKTTLKGPIPAFGELNILKKNVSEGFKNIIYVSSYIQLDY